MRMPKVVTSCVLVAVALALVPLGCDDQQGDSGPTTPDQMLSDSPITTAIDTGATLDLSPGNGVGVFVQYATGGHWTINTSCDTSTSGAGCGFDVFVIGSTDATKLTDPAGISLNPNDAVDIYSDGSLHLGTVTTTGVDGMTFDATEGGTLELEMYLDGAPQGRFVYWVGDKVLHAGAPTNPILLAPSAP